MLFVKYGLKEINKISELKLGIVCHEIHDPDAVILVAEKDGIIYGLCERIHGPKNYEMGYMPIKRDVGEEQE